MKWFKRIIKIFLIIFIIFTIVVIIDIIRSRITSVDDISNLTKVKMYDDKDEVFYEINNLHESTYVKIEDINPIALHVFVQTEDKHFYDHSGFNIYSITKAFFHNLKSNDVHGGSTITQQYVKNIYLNNKKSLIRKIREAYFAVKLERIYTKDEILEGYLNSIYFGHGIYGIFDASKYYFNKRPKDLTLAESAVLVSIIRSPSSYCPDDNYEKNNARKIEVLNNLKKNNSITMTQYIEALNQKIIITKTKYSRYPNSVLFYKDLVLREIKEKKLKQKNIEIYTFYNKEVNSIIDKYIEKHQISSDLSLIIESKEGHIISTIGNRSYRNNSYNIGIDGKRMIGSTIKPMLYYEALQNGMNALSKFTSEPTTVYIKKEPYIFSNYNNTYENKKITMAYALATSDNIYAVKTHLYLGSSKLISFLKRFSVDNIQNYPSLALGTVEMPLIKLVQIYQTFSTLGTYYLPATVKGIKANEKIVYLKQDIGKKMLNQSTCFILSDLLTGTFDTNMNSVNSVTGTRIANKLTCKVAAKSGLTDYDSYIVGFTPNYTVGIWTGYEKNLELNDPLSQQFPKNIFVPIMNNLALKNKNIWYEKPNDVYAQFTSPTGFKNGYQKNIYFKH